MIEVSTVTKRYGSTPVVDAVSLKLPKGGLTSILGPNGAGKSTLLSMIARLSPMDGGSIIIEGLDITSTPGDVLARKIAMLRQDNHMTMRLTVWDLVAFGRYPHSKGRLTDEDKVHVERALGYLGLDDLKHRFLDELSGGQRQRVFVAMVIAQDTDYMLFDEPLNNLDINHSVAMMRLMKDAARTFGKTAVVVLHDINFASCYSDHIVVMKNGKVALEGGPEEVIQPDLMEGIFGCPFRIHEIDGNRIAVYYR